MSGNLEEKDISITYEIIKKSKEKYEEQFNGTFYVVFHPLLYHSKTYKSDTKDVLSFIKLLKEHNIRVLEYPIKENITYSIPHDLHPNGKLNKFFAEELSEDLMIEQVQYNN